MNFKEKIRYSSRFTYTGCEDVNYLKSQREEEVFHYVN